jgi:hypothetical protein
LKSFSVPENDDGAYLRDFSGYYSNTVNTAPQYLNEIEMIRKYRQISLIAEVDDAIDDICEQAIASDEKSVSLNLDKCDDFFSKNVQDLIINEFDYILRLLKWNSKAYELFRRFYVDGRLYYHIVISDNEDEIENGILDLRYIDSICIQKVKEIVRNTDATTGAELINVGSEYYLYNKMGYLSSSVNANIGTKISTDSIAAISSGLMNENKTMILSYLHKAIKPLNQLTMAEDAAIIYRITRAPEKRVFYIDVGSLPPQKAEQYVYKMMSGFKNKLSYNSNTGEVKDMTNVMAITEDFWFPRGDNSRGTQIDTLPAGQNLGIIDDIDYFRRKFLKALKIPYSRTNPESGFSLGRSTEITRDEVKFDKFVRRIRKKFNDLFLQLLKTQLILKNVMSASQFDEASQYFEFDWVSDMFFVELKTNEILRERLSVAADMEQFVGRYFSRKYIRKEILKQTDEDIERIEEDNNSDPEIAIVRRNELMQLQQLEGQ